jgi:hypothetical protein
MRRRPARAADVHREDPSLFGDTGIADLQPHAATEILGERKSCIRWLTKRVVHVGVQQRVALSVDRLKGSSGVQV